MMYALEPRVHDAVWQFIQADLGQPPTEPRRGRPRVPDSVVFRALLLRLTTGNTWETIEFSMNYAVSDTTMRSRRDEWIADGVFHKLVAAAVNAYRRVIGFDFTHAFIDGTNFRALRGGEGTGLDPKHPGKRGWKAVLVTDAVGVPFGFTIDAANRNDYPLMFRVLDDLKTRDQLRFIGTLHADRGFNYDSTSQRLADDYSIADFRAPARNAPYQGRTKRSPLGPRWIVERTNAWEHAYGQLTHNRDRKSEHRHAALCFAIALFLIHRISHTQHSTWRTAN